MSYDLRLFAVPDGGQVEAAYQRLLEREETKIGSVDERVKRRLSASAHTEMQQLADALKARWAAFIQFEPKSPLPYIELNEENLQIQVSVYEDSVSITRPYFRRRTTEMLNCINCCIQVCHERRGYIAFDPQLRRAVTAADGESLTQAYHQMDRVLPGVRGEGHGNKPWWRFWSR